MFEAMLEWRKEIGADTIKEVRSWCPGPLNSLICKLLATTFPAMKLCCAGKVYSGARHDSMSDDDIVKAAQGILLPFPHFKDWSWRGSFCMTDLPVSRKRCNKGAISPLSSQDR
jgi:hypothetical protein